MLFGLKVMSYDAFRNVFLDDDFNGFLSYIFKLFFY